MGRTAGLSGLAFGSGPVTGGGLGAIPVFGPEGGTDGGG